MYGKIGNSKAYMNLKSSYIFYNHYFVAVEWNIQNAYEATLNCLYNQVRGLIGKSQLYLQVRTAHDTPIQNFFIGLNKYKLYTT